MSIIKKTFQLSPEREVTIETGKIARQADGSVVLRVGNTMLLAAIVSNPTAKDNIDFLPLTVDYQERFAASGKVPGGFTKRENRLSDYEVLICRLIDRVARPLFPDDYHADTQININLISYDGTILPDSLAALAAAAAIAVSDIPFNGPFSEVRVIRKDGKFIINPTPEDILLSDLDLMVGATEKDIVMVEGEANEVSEEVMVEAIKVAHDAIKIHCRALAELTIEVGKTEKRTYSHENSDEELQKDITDFSYSKIYEIAKKGVSKKERKASFDEVYASFIETLSEEKAGSLDSFLAKKYFHDVEKKAMRDLIVNEKFRLDGRKTNEIRPIWSEVAYLPNAHGSAVFTRGETQSLTSVTLGSKLDEKLIDGAVFSGHDKFMLHYNFPSYSVGEVRPNRGPGRREIGHGNLAQRSLKKVMPGVEVCPYTVRIVSDILESNGSSSMATVCAGSLALMDAGVKITSPVSGIAMGLIKRDNEYVVLSDILGDEDHLGDMDFKVTGTKNGIVGCQMDIKIDGLPYEVLVGALKQAKEGRDHILSKMNETLAAPMDDYKSHTPRIVAFPIDGEFIGAVIGPGGKVIQEIQKVTGTKVSIEEVGKQGIVQVYSNDKESLDKAVKWIMGIAGKPEVGTVYMGKVKSIQPYGAFVEIMPGKDGLLHISEISWSRLSTVEGVLEVGQEIEVKLIEVDPKTNKLKLSAKVLLPKPEAAN